MIEIFGKGRPMKILLSISFLIIAISIYVLMHYYVYHRITVDLDLRPPLTHYLKILFILLGLTFIAGEFLNRIYSLKFLLIAGSVWLGVLCISVSFFLLKDILNILISQHNRALAITALFLIAGSSVFAVLNAVRPPVIREVRVKISGKNLKSSRMTLVQLSDIHLNSATSPKQVRDIVTQVNACQADLIVITGDLMDAHVCRIKDFIGTLGKMKARYGIYAVTGNHEFYNGMGNFLELCKTLGIRFLNNEGVIVDGRLNLAGINDLTGKNYPGYAPDLAKALKGLDPGRPTVLLHHQPLGFPEAAGQGVDLQLSGHIHNGQLPPIYPLVYILYKYPYGLYSYKNSFINTTAGTGTWGPPMRLFSRSEIVKIILE